MITINKLSLAAFAIISLTAASAMSSEMGYMVLKDSSQASIDALIIDGQTTKDQIKAAMGTYEHDNPKIAASQGCKPAAKFCIYMVNVGSFIRSNSYVKSVTVTYDDNNVVKTHKFSETHLK